MVVVILNEVKDLLFDFADPERREGEGSAVSYRVS
jgi:hypothetical protein